MPNKYREMLAQAIERNGGYHAGRGESFALEFNVALYDVDLSPEHLYPIARAEFMDDLPPLSPAINWDTSDVWETVQFDMAHGLHVDYAYSTYGPTTAARYGLPYYGARHYSRIIKGRDSGYYPAKVAGWKIEKPYINESFDVEMGLYGRGGKHLCIESFEGVNLRMSSDDLADAIRNDDCGDYPNKWCVRLLAMIDEWSEVFTQKNAAREMEYQAASQLAWIMQERRDAWRAALKEARARKYWACRDVETAEA